MTTVISTHQLKPATSLKVCFRQMTLLAILLAVLGTCNAFTAVANSARVGIFLPWWKPAIWEFSSILCLWLLIPVVGWWLRQFPLIQPRWPLNLPGHLLATLPFSLVHVAGMVALRDLVYRLPGGYYQFGPWWTTWFYEYRKDFVS